MKRIKFWYSSVSKINLTTLTDVEIIICQYFNINELS